MNILPCEARLIFDPHNEYKLHNQYLHVKNTDLWLKNWIRYPFVDVPAESNLMIHILVPFVGNSTREDIESC